MAEGLRFRYGDIVEVGQLLDPQGRNPKDRPCVLITPDWAIVEGGRLDVVAITTKLPDPLPPDHVRLPWQFPRHPVTGLNRPNAAVCTWLDQVEWGRALRRIGVTPGPRLGLIELILGKLYRGGGG